MDLETIMLSEVNQTTRHQRQMLPLTCGIRNKDTMNFAEQMLTYLMVSKGDRLWGWPGVWDGNAIKLGYDDGCRITNVLKLRVWGKKEKEVNV